MVLGGVTAYIVTGGELYAGWGLMAYMLGFIAVVVGAWLGVVIEVEIKEAKTLDDARV